MEHGNGEKTSTVGSPEFMLASSSHYWILSKSYKLPNSQIHIFQNPKSNSICLTMLLRGLNELLHAKQLLQCLELITLDTHSNNVSLFYH